MITCTNMKTFKVAMDVLKDIKGGVIVSVIEKFVCKAAHGSTDNVSKVDILKVVVDEYLKVIKPVQPDVQV
jgi:hypothetical protein